MSKIQEYGLACAEAAVRACVRIATRNGNDADFVRWRLQEANAADIASQVPLPEPEVAREPSGPGWWWARWKSRGAWAPVNVVEREAHRDGADVMVWRVQEIGDSWEFDLWEFDAWLPNPAPTTLAPPTAAPETATRSHG